MSTTPSWIRRLSETDENLLEFGIPAVSLYSSVSSGSTMGSRTASSGYLSRSRDNVADLMRSNRDLRGEFVSDRFNPRGYNHHGNRRRSNDRSRDTYGTPNRGYISDNENRTYRSDPNLLDSLDNDSLPRFLTSRDLRTLDSRELRESRNAALRGAGGSRSDMNSVHEDNGTLNSKKEPNRNDSWSYVDTDGYSHLSVSDSCCLTFIPASGETWYIRYNRLWP